MTENQINLLATILEGTWPKQYLSKDHKSTVATLRFHFASANGELIIKQYKEFARTRTTAPSVAEVLKAIEKPKFQSVFRPKYWEDEDGYGYMYDEREKADICIWKPHYKEKGITKMEVLRKYGLASEV